MTELKDKYRLLRQIFKAPDGEDFSATIQRVLDSDDRNGFFDKYREVFPDLSRDELRPCWQFWYSDRDEKKQDFTPEPLADLCAHVLTMAEGKTVYDCCAGSGALTIAVWNQLESIRCGCVELDETVIPLLLFNLAVRNIEGVVQHGNALTGQVTQSWELIKGEAYSGIVPQMFPEAIGSADLAIANPPYNIRYNGKKQNFAFVNKCIGIAKRAVLLLPCGTMTSKDEIGERALLCERQFLQSVVALPENLFESTGIPVAMYVLDRRPKDGAMLVDATALGEKYIREQRGEDANACRIYKKEMVRFTEQQVAAIQQMTEREAGPSLRVSYEEMAGREYCFSRGPYVPVDIDDSHTVHRAYSDIITDINRVKRMLNTVKVTVNKVWAEQLGLRPLLDLSEQEKNLSRSINEQLASIGIVDKIIEPDYIAQTNSKELKIVQTDKEVLSPVLESFIPLWYQHIRTMNNFEKMLLAELRDALLEPLLTGRIGFIEDDETSETINE